MSGDTDSLEDVAPLKVSTIHGVKIYNCSAGKTLPQWFDEARKSKKSLRKNNEFRTRIELVQDLHFPTAATKIKLTPDGDYAIAAGVYKPRVKVFDLNQLSLKFERFLDSAVVQLQCLSPDWTKFVLLRDDRFVEIHAPFGMHHKVRIPKFGRDLAYHFPSCDLYLAGSSSEVYRLNLDQGRFMAPLETDMPAINVCGFNEHHQLLGLGGENGVCEFWDARDRTKAKSLFVPESVAKTDRRVAMALLNTPPEVSALRFGPAGLTMALGLSSGHCALYDLRSSKPILVKDHRYGLPVHTVKFHGDKIVSSDAKVIRIWDGKTGKAFTAVEPSADINHVTVVKDSGLIFAAAETSRVQVFYIPQLGTAPKWCSFLENLTEEMEEKSGALVYDDVKFVTRQQLEDWGLSNLIGTKHLRAYMHGFFMDIRMYNRVREASDPQAYESYVRQKIEKEIEKRRASHITAQKHLPSVNKMYAKMLLAQPKLQRLLREREEAEQNGAAAADDASAKASEVTTPFTDPRFGKLFTDAAYQIDVNSEEYKRLHPSAHRKRVVGACTCVCPPYCLTRVGAGSSARRSNGPSSSSSSGGRLAAKFDRVDSPDRDEEEEEEEEEEMDDLLQLSQPHQLSGADSDDDMVYGSRGNDDVPGQGSSTLLSSGLKQLSERADRRAQRRRRRRAQSALYPSELPPSDDEHEHAGPSSGSGPAMYQLKHEFSMPHLLKQQAAAGHGAAGDADDSGALTLQERLAQLRRQSTSKSDPVDQPVHRGRKRKGTPKGQERRGMSGILGGLQQQQIRGGYRAKRGRGRGRGRGGGRGRGRGRGRGGRGRR